MQPKPLLIEGLRIKQKTIVTFFHQLGRDVSHPCACSQLVTCPPSAPATRQARRSSCALPPYHHRRSPSSSFANRDSQHRATASKTTTAAQNPKPATSRSLGGFPSSIRILPLPRQRTKQHWTINPHPNTGISCGRLDFVVSSTLCRTVPVSAARVPGQRFRIGPRGGSPSACCRSKQTLCVAPKQCGLKPDPLLLGVWVVVVLALSAVSAVSQTHSHDDGISCSPSYPQSAILNSGLSLFAIAHRRTSCATDRESSR